MPGLEMEETGEKQHLRRGSGILFWGMLAGDMHETAKRDVRPLNLVLRVVSWARDRACIQDETKMYLINLQNLSALGIIQPCVWPMG